MLPFSGGTTAGLRNSFGNGLDIYGFYHCRALCSSTCTIADMTSALEHLPSLDQKIERSGSKHRILALLNVLLNDDVVRSQSSRVSPTLACSGEQGGNLQQDSGTQDQVKVLCLRTGTDDRTRLGTLLFSPNPTRFPATKPNVSICAAYRHRFICLLRLRSCCAFSKAAPCYFN